MLQKTYREARNMCSFDCIKCDQNSRIFIRICCFCKKEYEKKKDIDVIKEGESEMRHPLNY